MAQETQKSISFPQKLSELLAQSTLVRQSTSWGNADVYLYELDGKKYLVKTFMRHNWMARFLFGDSIETEYRILKQLEEHCPTYAPIGYALLGKYTIIMEYIDGGQALLSKRHYTAESMPPPELFQNIAKALLALHHAGFAHGDFRRANLLITNTDHVRIIDWATGSYINSSKHPGWLRRTLHNWRVSSDIFSLVKITESYYHDILPAEIMIAAQPGPLLKTGRFIRRHFYRHGIKRLFDLFRKT